ncbi:hypothetical protein GCM10010174_36340 [Kutzneria viridogrisea]|uniref:CHRD domain-containing protein n=1 Tax=Kutzneria viridogrisea TaxID=47990 RepID=A0ABR6BU83_9PSEU|nr:hypothetical protein [Kutzneria viridogrisea]
MSKRTRTLFSLVMAAGLVVGAGTAARAGTPPRDTGAVYLAAELSGANEVPAAAKRGRGVAVLRVQGDQVSYAIQWTGVTAPTAGHVHLGAKGVNGAVEVPFFGAGIPSGVTAVLGHVTVPDKALLTSLRTDPAGHYANLHTAEFPSGALRGQFRRLEHPVDLAKVLRVGLIAAQGGGDQELAGGDPDGGATAQFDAEGGAVRYSLTWSGVGQPTKGHIHKGGPGVDGDVVVDLFAAPNGLPGSITGLAGSVTGVPEAIAHGIENSPARYYVNLHNAEFPGGAVRGQLYDVDEADSDLPGF